MSVDTKIEPEILFSFYIQQQESLDNPNRLSAGEIINCEDTKNGKERSGSSGDPLVVSIGKILDKGRKFLIFWLKWYQYIIIYIIMDITNH